MSIQYRFFLLFFLFSINYLFSITAPPGIYEVEQANGKKIPVRMYGHQYYNWIETIEGYVIDWVDDGSASGWFYVDLDNEGQYFTTKLFVTYPAPFNLGIPKKDKGEFSSGKKAFM